MPININRVYNYEYCEVLFQGFISGNDTFKNKEDIKEVIKNPDLTCNLIDKYLNNTKTVKLESILSLFGKVRLLTNKLDTIEQEKAATIIEKIEGLNVVKEVFENGSFIDLSDENVLFEIIASSVQKAEDPSIAIDLINKYKIKSKDLLIKIVKF